MHFKETQVFYLFFKAQVMPPTLWIHISLCEASFLCERCLDWLDPQPQLAIMLSLSLFFVTHMSLTMSITNHIQACILFLSD